MDSSTGHLDQDPTSRPGRRPPSHLRRIRLLQGRSQAEVADAAGISRTTLVSLEAERSQPQLGTAQALAACLGEPVEVLFPTRTAS